MEEATANRWFNYKGTFVDTAFLQFGAGIVLVLLLAWVLTLLLSAIGKLEEKRKRELLARIKTWGILVVAMGVPLFLGALWTVLGLLLLTIFCYREFARITGLFRNYLVSAAVVIGILFTFFAVIDHWYGLFSAIPMLGVMLIVSLGVFSDRPDGYLQRIALASLAFLIFGTSLGHVAYMTNDPGFRSILLLFLISVEMNDVFAYLFGNLWGRKKLAPHTSPNKTMGGALGALIGTTTLVLILGGMVFEGSPLDSPAKLILLGLIISITGQLGDLVISSVKRDIGIKDTGKLLPGHGGILDRFDSILLAGPAFFHFVGYFNGFGLDEPVRIFSGGS